MRRLDEQPIEPSTTAALEAIDATLAGEPVDPRQAELAELALVLVAQRPEPDPAFASSLDEQVQRRFAVGAHARKRAPRWKLAGAGAIALAAVVAVVVVLSSQGSRGPSPQATAPSGPARATAGPARAARSAAAAAASPASPQPPANGRKTIQAAQLALTAPPPRIDGVAQQVFDVVGAENGIVNRSTVTATGGPDGYADFDLSVPSAGLPDTMARLSRLRYAQVASRTDTTRDVNNQFLDAGRRLADAQALRTSLLRQLANATTQQQIGSIQVQIRDADAAVARAQADLRALNHQVGYSQIALTINARVVAISHGGSFTLGRAAHDAGRVLTVAAGVALIALAALVPVALLGAIAWWIATALRRRRREQALDLA